jgi:hypothetical protein
MGEQNTGGFYTPAGQRCHLLQSAVTVLAMSEDWRSGAMVGLNRGIEQQCVSVAQIAPACCNLYDACSERTPANVWSSVVKLIDPDLDVIDEKLSKFTYCYPRRPVARAVVPLMMQSGCRNYVHLGRATNLGETHDISACARHAVDHCANADCVAFLDFTNGDGRVVEEDVRENRGNHRAVEDEVFVSVGGPKLSWINVSEYGSNNTHLTTFTSPSSRMAPVALNLS